MRIVEESDLPTSPATNYLFGYSGNSINGYGQLNTITLPTGAKVAYTYHRDNTVGKTEDLVNSPVKTKSLTHDGVTDMNWQYVFNNTSSIFTRDVSVVTTNHFYDPKILSDWRHGLVWKITGRYGSIREQVWAQNPVYGRPSVDANNPYVQKELITVGTVQEVPTKTAITESTFDKNGNLRSRTEYDWVNYGTTTGSTVKRQTALTYHYPAPLASDNTDSIYGYWRPHNGPSYWPVSNSPRRLDAVKRREVSSASAVQAVSEFDYDNAFQQGNVEAERRWDNTKPNATTPDNPLSASKSVVFARGYDDYGNLIAITGPEVPTSFTYGTDGSYPYPTKISHAGGARSVTVAWHLASGTPTSQTDDQNGTQIDYSFDALSRPLTVTEAGLRRTTTIYDDAARTVTVKRDLETLGDGKLQTATHYDQLGRVRLTRSTDGAPLGTSESDGIKVKTSYFVAVGTRRVITSTPYRSLTDATLEWTCSVYDALGRVALVGSGGGVAGGLGCRACGHGSVGYGDGPDHGE